MKEEMKPNRLMFWRLLPLLAVVVLALAAGLTAAPTSTRTADAAHTTFAVGDVFAGVANGLVNWYHPDGTLNAVLNTGSPGTFTTGMAFDGAGNLYVTNFDAGDVKTFDTSGALIGTFGSGYSGAPESIVFDASGNAYVGAVNGDNDIRKFDAAGTPLAQYNVATEARGSDWIDLAADQCTMFYTSEGTHVKRYDVCTDTQLPDFAGGLHGPAYALRILPDGGVLVADSVDIHRLDATGAIVQTYDAPGENNWFALNRDVDGTSFWSGDLSNMNFYKFDIATGAVLLGPIGPACGGLQCLAGLAVFGEPTVGIGIGCSESPISPSSVEVAIFPGDSVDVDKCVETPDIPPKPDIYFLADTTGSMGAAIGGVQADATSIIAAIDAATTDPRYGAGDYKDFPFSAYAFNNDASIPAGDDGGAAALAAIGAWSATGGNDAPEGQLFALDQIADPGDPAGISFRTDSTKIVVWFGDQPGHDPVCSAISGLGYDITEASATAKLVAEGFKVVAISTTSGAGLDADPTIFGGDYVAACGVEDGAAGQATRITAATGGVHLAGVAPEDIAEAILDAIGSVSVEVEMVSTCTDPITTTFSPATQTVVSGDLALFTETISVAADAPGGTYTCTDRVLIDGELLLDETGAPVEEVKVIRVPEGFLTGGGQITNGRGRNVERISFGGNVGFLADGTFMGQWQTNFHNVIGTPLDRAKFHSTEIVGLQFFNDAGEGPDPPPANANIGSFVAVGRLGGEDGWLLAVCLADRGEPGKDNDSIRLQLVDPGGAVQYDSFDDFVSEDDTLDGLCEDRHQLDAGNFQIHSGVKD